MFFLPSTGTIQLKLHLALKIHDGKIFSLDHARNEE
jgi:hypothetical protein